MNWSGKITGLFIGLIFGPVGIIIGLILGHLYDIGLFDRYFARYGYKRNTYAHTKAQQIFFDATFAVMGHIAKSDGHISEREIEGARHVMSQLGLTGAARQRAIEKFYSGKAAHFNLDAELQQLKQTCWRHPTLMRTFIEVQIYIANIEGSVTPKKRAIIQNICAQLGLRGFNFNQSEQQSRAEYNYQRYYQNGSQANAQYTSRSQLSDAFKILGVTESAEKEEVTKAYRRQMSKHHPDKLMAKGLPPEMIKMANQKTSQIKKAYETIKASKGW